jgi:hypothetical protein
LSRNADRLTTGRLLLHPEPDLPLLDLGRFKSKRRQVDRNLHQRLFRPFDSGRDI